MDLTDLILSRHSVRDFSEEPISDAELDKILEAGRRLHPLRTSNAGVI